MTGEATFHRLQSACVEAFRAGVLRSAGRLGDRTCQFRFAGEACARALLAPFSHVLDKQLDDVPPSGLKIDVFDASETGIPEPLESLDPNKTASEFGWVVGGPGDRFVGCYRPGVYAWRDRKAEHLVVCVRDHEHLEVSDRAKPLLYPLLSWHAEIGLPVLHAALVACENRGILLVGPSGSGKTTTAIACVRSGRFSYLADDYVGLQRRTDGSFSGHSLYCSAWLDASTRRFFPEVENHVMSGSTAKTPILMDQVWPGQIARLARIVAIAIPEVAHQVDTSVSRAGAVDALQAFAPTSVMKRPGSGKALFDKAGALVEQTPVFRVKAGHDMTRLSDAITGILDTLSRGRHA